MPPKRKLFRAASWLEPNSDNEWEPSVIPSSLSKRRKISHTGEIRTFESPKNPHVVTSDEEPNMSSISQINTVEVQLSAEPFVEMSSSDEQELGEDTINAHAHSTLEPETYIDMSTDDEISINDEQEVIPELTNIIPVAEPYIDMSPEDEISIPDDDMLSHTDDEDQYVDISSDDDMLSQTHDENQYVNMSSDDDMSGNDTEETEVHDDVGFF